MEAQTTRRTTDPTSERGGLNAGATAPGPRVCLLIGAYHPIIGGGETQMKLLMQGLRRRGLEVSVVTQRRPAHVRPFEQVDGVPVHRVRPRGRDRTGKYWMMAPAFAKLLALRGRYDVILVSGVRTLGVVGVVAAHLLRKRCVLRIASCGEMSGTYLGGGAGRRRALSPLLRMRNGVLLRADAFLAVSRAAESEYLACGARPGRITLVPNGTDLERFRPAGTGPASARPVGAAEERRLLRRELGLPEHAPIFVYSGKLNRGKGLPMLLRAWRRLRDEGRDAVLVLVGGGGNQSLSCEPELRALSREMDLDRSVVFTGYTERVADHLRAADAFVLPSDSEAMPNALVEAMATGLPCIASAVGGILDILDDGRNGRMVPAGDEDRLLDALRETLADPAAAGRWGAEARRDAERRFGSDANTESVLLLLRQAWDRKGEIPC